MAIEEIEGTGRGKPTFDFPEEDARNLPPLPLDSDTDLSRKDNGDMSTSNPPQTTATATPALENLLGQVVFITLSDARTIIGYFTCVDRGGNIILREAEEFPAPPKNEEEEEMCRNREEYWPRSEPFAGWGTGWGGRGMGLVGVNIRDVDSIRVRAETWVGLGGNGGGSEGDGDGDGAQQVIVTDSLGART